MQTVDKLRSKLKKGKAYRREDLMQWSSSIDRHLAQLLEEGSLMKLAQGIYYVPKPSAFGPTPPDEHEVIKVYLKDDDFLMISPNYYNSLELGTTQLYNRKRIYNHKKHEDVQLGNKVYEFRRKPKFPAKLTQEYLIVDLLNNLKYVAEDEEIVLQNLQKKLHDFDLRLLNSHVLRYGTIKAKKTIRALQNNGL